jgi:undecaprenyl-diphosphooligosaccharide--protein glycosyltransferase
MANTGKRWHEFRLRHVDLWLGLVFVIAGVTYATAARLSQLSAWERSPALYVASGVPMMTTLDAYYSLRIARLHAAGVFVPHGPAPARHYARPEQGSPGEWYDQREPQFLPLLSRAIAAASIIAAGDIDKTGLILPPLLSSLFMVPLFLCCWRLGVPVAGIMGGLVATFCVEYYRRTGVGWVDTDVLNLFFPWTISFLILMMSADQRRDRLLLLAAAAGAVSYVFYLWYPKPGITALYVAAMAAHLLLAGVSWRRCALCVAVLVMFANPVQLGAVLGSFEDFVHRYLLAAPAQQADVSSAIRFPAVWSTITEAKSLHWAESLRLILQRTDVTAIGLVAFVPFALWRWRAMAALAPVLLLGALALLSARRLIPYLAPFVGIGWGLIIALLIKGLLDRLGVEHGTVTEAPHTPMISRLKRLTQSFMCKPAAQTTSAYVGVVAVFIAWFAPLSG